MFADSHCHLNYPGLVEDQRAVIDRARSRGVTAMLNISTREREWDAIVATAEREADVWASIGIHPHEADAHPDVGAARLVTAAAHPRVVALGETGLDYHYISRPRAIPACRSSSIPAMRRTTPPRS
jgi:TatD DNase family protein